MPQTDTRAEDTVALVETILNTHHVYLKRHLPLLSIALRDAVAPASGHAPTHEFAEAFVLLRNELTAHLEKEEQILFPTIHELCAARAEARPAALMPCGVHGPIGQMRLEHTQAKALLQRLVAAADLPGDDERAPRISDAVRGQVRDLEADLREHIRKEDDLLFPQAEALFDSAAAP